MRAKLTIASLGTLALLAVLAACDWELRPTDEELGLSPQQAHGRRLYDSRCHLCHEPYGVRQRRGPSLMNMWQQEHMFDGRPLTEENVRRLIREGVREERRFTMPPFDRRLLDEQQMEDLMEYLKTL